ncbi:MAG: hypothetical protein WC410_00465 [Candidatus Paceibacterota bacterium]|jgi:hypothetical protein|nr:hypothetical protein [Candidatus Paceibacterota bacterium]MDD5555389.1 hypothetical protein [Candidatus Paceibacterota bacterium]
MDKDYFPVEKPGQKKSFGSSYIKFKDDKGKERKLGDQDYFESLRSKDENKDRVAQELEKLKIKSSKKPAQLEILNKLLKKDE